MKIVFFWLAPAFFMNYAYARTINISMADKSCEASIKKQVVSAFDEAAQKLASCLPLHQRNEDLKKIEEILYKKTINITCESDAASGNAAIATSAKFADAVPEMKINTYAFRESSLNVLADTLMHESLHWLGYKHYKTYDLPYIATICCGSPKDIHISTKDLACDLLKLKNDEWKTPNYVRKFSAVMTQFGIQDVAIKTGFYSGYMVNQKEATKEAVLDLLYAPVEEINDLCIQSPQEFCRKLYQNASSIPIGIIMAYAVDKNSKFVKTVAKELYPTKRDKLKLSFFYKVSEVVTHLLFNDTAKLKAAAQRVKDAEAGICPQLKESEIQGVQTLMRLKPKATLAEEFFENPADEIPYELGALCAKK